MRTTSTLFYQFSTTVTPSQNNLRKETHTSSLNHFILNCSFPCKDDGFQSRLYEKKQIEIVVAFILDSFNVASQKFVRKPHIQHPKNIQNKK